MDGSDPSTEVKRGAEAMWEALVAEGVEVVFGYPGGCIMPAYDVMPRYPVRHILCRHEQGAAHMADGYARVSGKVGVAIATSGPGATNLVTGIATAMLDSIPVVFITGQVPSKFIGTDAFQETDITGVTIPITKHNYLVTRAEEVYPILREAFELARSGRPGPVVVDITKDALQNVCAPVAPKPATSSKRPSRAKRGLAPSKPISEHDLDRAAALIASAQRPVILAGHGIVRSGSTELVTQLVEKCDIPVGLTLLGLGGFPATHPHALGMMGMHGEAWVNQAIQEADLLIALGMRFDDRVTGNLATYAKNAKKIHVEIDPAEVDKNVRVDVALIGDLKEVLERLLPRVADKKHAAWNAALGAKRAEVAPIDIVNTPHDGRLFAAHVMHDLYRLTEGKAVVVTDVGQHQMWEAQYYKHDHPRGLVTSGGLGTMGFALPAGIGAAFAAKEKEVWIIAGDGGFQMTAAELSTCVQDGIKVNVAIINNGYLGMVRQWQELFYGGRYVATPIVSPDFVKLADAHGLPGMRVTKREEIPAAVAAARATDKTFVVEFRVEAEDAVYPMVPAGADLHDMIRRPSKNNGGAK
ncbi:biosynthetic-type acetolactate synthase large subunit [Sandaracinus amylolyticus]|uniref:biosynthetic-type acetolactate synthase large subunit n=1 Tax=Sandaracinus amylolyticus TaxID=927083 RepID=UPI001F02DEC3|nr:biosynthetic-type acetolactate synthase large subunit [Sandaracinus amylolyticus]UJR79326.1 Biosynthetic-type acetolactate synthase large subunit [Sandaracinus amylolyticus]